MEKFIRHVNSGAKPTNESYERDKELLLNAVFELCNSKQLHTVIASSWRPPKKLEPSHDKLTVPKECLYGVSCPHQKVGRCPFSHEKIADQ